MCRFKITNFYGLASSFICSSTDFGIDVIGYYTARLASLFISCADIVGSLDPPGLLERGFMGVNLLVKSMSPLQKYPPIANGSVSFISKLVQE